MAKKELKKEAEAFAEEHAFRVPYDGSNKFYDDIDFKASKEGYLAAAKPREKQIKKLKQQIKQMKSDVIKYFGEENNVLVARLLKEWKKEVDHEGCPDVLCEDCTEEDCTVRKLGLVPTKEN